MAGHSQFKNIVHRKNAQDAKKNRIFTRLVREITAAVQAHGNDPAVNSRLRSALTAARVANMSQETIKRAMQKNENSDNLHDILYEGYGPLATAWLVEVLTDNRNRTASEIRTLFNKHGGKFGERVQFLFQRQGRLRVKQREESLEDFIATVDTPLSALDTLTGEIMCPLEGFSTLCDFYTQHHGDPLEASLVMLPTSPQIFTGDDAEKITVFRELLESHDDVQHVWTNSFLPESSDL